MSAVVNDIHSRLNATKVGNVVEVSSLESIASTLRTAQADGQAVSVAGGQHAMGGQQFAAAATLLDTRTMKRVLAFDRERGLVEVEAGIQWPDLVDVLGTSQDDAERPWAIAQKQTGADRFTIGGSISSNGHGRGLTMCPLVADVESIRVVKPDGSVVDCSRDVDSDLFRLVVGGYGLFGVIYAVTLRLTPRQKLERVVEMVRVPDLEEAFAERIANGFLYGDLQFAIDPGSSDFLWAGILSCYRPVDPETPIPPKQRVLSRVDWQRLLVLAHADKARAFDEYSRHYLASSGQIYWSDLHQLGDYVDGYHEALDQLLGAEHPASEVIGELYVPGEHLADFMAAAAEDFRRERVDVIYGTIRLIRRDEDTYLPWAKQDYACVIFNLHTVHTDEGLAHSAGAFRRLTDFAVERGGSYFLTYHRWATRDQVDACYPQFAEFLRLKRDYDPGEVLQSDWYRHYRELFADKL